MVISDTGQTLIGVKSEFEAEGLTQLEVADFFSQNPWAHLRVVKIGGCEAKTDFRAALRLGCNTIVAPMIESEFALAKFGQMYSATTNVNRWINIETTTGVQNLSKILDICAHHNVSGVVIGRGDLAESMGLERSSVDSAQVQEVVIQIAEKAKERNMHVGVGGMVSLNSVSNLGSLSEQGLIDHFETRKILVSSNARDFELEIRQSLAIENAWIKSSISNLYSMTKDLEARSARLSEGARG